MWVKPGRDLGSRVRQDKGAEEGSQDPKDERRCTKTFVWFPYEMASTVCSRKQQRSSSTGTMMSLRPRMSGAECTGDGRNQKHTNRFPKDCGPKGAQDSGRTSSITSKLLFFLAKALRNKKCNPVVPSWPSPASGLPLPDFHPFNREPQITTKSGD